ncbi:MAG: hypothetical protein IKE53_10125 [Clostridiales bacterium]|nr:hypothetical protein [Clostridiales bacterium]
MRTLKSIVVILTALSILAAGVILPDLLINRKLEGQIKAKNYIESEDMHRYGEEFFESKEHLNKVLLHAGEVWHRPIFSTMETMKTELPWNRSWKRLKGYMRTTGWNQDIPDSWIFSADGTMPYILLSAGKTCIASPG